MRIIKMLKGIPEILSPALLKALCEMGHSDRLVIADGNFPAESVGKDAIVVRMDGHGVPEVLAGILEVFPLDGYVEKPVTLMEKVEGDKAENLKWNEFEKIIKKYDARGKDAIGFAERFRFYEEAGKAYLIIATSEQSLYANIMLQKGIVTIT
jgi:L-fucose mutarotase